MEIAHHSSANAQNHWAVPAHEGFKSGFIALGKEGFQQLRIAQVATIGQEHGLAQVMQDLIHLADRHLWLSRPQSFVSYYCPQPGWRVDFSGYTLRLTVENPALHDQSDLAQRLNIACRVTIHC